jgi:hypothetical protein
MEAIFKTIGYTISEIPNQPSDREVTFLYIKNPDGSARWIWEKTQNQPLFLKFYSTSSFKAKIFAVLVRLLFYIKLQNFIFSSKTFYVLNESSPLF